MKSKPIGIRFDLDKLDMIQKEKNLTSVQQVVNYLMDNYNRTDSNLPHTVLDGKFNAKVIKVPQKELKNGNPEPPSGLAGIDLAIWKSENWDKH
jgi:hypothetical protein